MTQAEQDFVDEYKEDFCDIIEHPETISKFIVRSFIDGQDSLFIDFADDDRLIELTREQIEWEAEDGEYIIDVFDRRSQQEVSHWYEVKLII